MQYGLQAKAVLKRAQAETIGAIFDIATMAAGFGGAPKSTGGGGNGMVSDGFGGGD